MRSLRTLLAVAVAVAVCSMIMTDAATAVLAAPAASAPSAARTAPTSNAPSHVRPESTPRGDNRTKRCKGRKVTIAAHKGRIVGTSRADVILATGKSNISGLGGNDLICGSRFADVINGGKGRDTIYAGKGRDRVSGGAGRDRVFGEGGNDRLNGGAQVDHLYGGPGKNRYNGRPANSVQRGSAQDVIDDNNVVVDLSLTYTQEANIVNSNSTVVVLRPTVGSPSTVPTIWQALPPQQQNVLSWEAGFSAFAELGNQAQAGSTVFAQDGVAIAPGQLASYANNALAVGPGAAGGFSLGYTAWFPAGATMGLAQTAAINGTPAGSSPFAVTSIDSGQQLNVAPTDSIRFMIVNQEVGPGTVVLPVLLDDAIALPANGSTLSLAWNAATGMFYVI